MKTLKMFQAVLVILVISILVGCSDQLTAPIDQANNKSGGIRTPVTSVSKTQEILPIYSYSTQIGLKQFRSYTFNVSNTGLAKFTGIDVENLSIDPNEDKIALSCQDIAITGDTKSDVKISCHSRGFEARQLTIQNLSSHLLVLRVSLYGIKLNQISTREE
jgi:hypothetical protein